jgi:hypothetical protein
MQFNDEPLKNIHDDILDLLDESGSDKQTPAKPSNSKP